jgi:Uma2 family endonuclease
MSQSYEEIFEGAVQSRPAPGDRHEKICARLHEKVTAGVNGQTGTKLLAPRTRIQVSPASLLCPDLALVTSATGKLFLAVEVIDRGDHQPDTVSKKEIYDKIRIPRLWVVDPRYDNVEIYHSTEWGLALKGILAGSEVLSDKLLPNFQITVTELFAAL